MRKSSVKQKKAKPLESKKINSSLSLPEKILRSRLLWILVHPGVSFTVVLFIISIFSLNSQSDYGVIGLVGSFFVPFLVPNAFFMGLYNFLPVSVRSSAVVAIIFTVIMSITFYLYYIFYIIFLVYIKKMSKRILYVCCILSLLMILLTFKGCAEVSYFTNPLIQNDIRVLSLATDKANKIGMESISSMNESHCDDILLVTYEFKNDYINEGIVEIYRDTCKTYVKAQVKGIGECVFDIMGNRAIINVTDNSMSWDCRQALVRTQSIENCTSPGNDNPVSCIIDGAISNDDIKFCSYLVSYGQDKVDSCRAQVLEKNPYAANLEDTGLIFEFNESYLSCGCGCCNFGRPLEYIANTVCLYKSNGENIQDKIDQDKNIPQASCASVGCSYPTKYVYCDT